MAYDTKVSREDTCISTKANDDAYDDGCAILVDA
jgi:hypothetical protein